MNTTSEIIHLNGQDITELDVQCIVVPAQNLPMEAESQYEYIKEEYAEFEPELEAELSGENGKYIINITEPQNDHKLLARYYLKCLELAKNNNISEIAFPVVGAGSMYDRTKAAQNAISTANIWKNSSLNNGVVKRIIFVTNDPVDDQAYEHMMNTVGTNSYANRNPNNLNNPNNPNYFNPNSYQPGYPNNYPYNNQYYTMNNPNVVGYEVSWWLCCIIVVIIIICLLVWFFNAGKSATYFGASNPVNYYPTTGTAFNPIY